MKKILVVEDNDTVRNNLIDILELNKYKTISAENGLDGFQLAVEQLPDLIISDVMMPVMDGYEFLNKVRETSPINYTPFIFLSAKSTYNDLRYGMNLSADDYLSKPFTVVELINAVENNLTKANKIDSKIEQLRDNIAFSIPHELRTPLTAILGFTDLLKDLIQTDSDKNEMLLMTDNIYDSGIRLNNVINKFILYSESSYVLVDSEMIKKFNDSSIESVEAYIKPTAEKISKKLGRFGDLKFDITDAAINLDNRHLNYFVEELTENACKYSQANSIIISAKIKNNFWIFSVTDHGVGMDEMRIKSIGALNQFGRKNNEVAGNGLGLSTLQKIIEIYRGELKIVSKPQCYTTVSIKIPIKQQGLKI
jgi:two-component system, sensor histidine kinase and response regulator